MLGSGRPFVLELLVPKWRSVDLSDAHHLVNERVSGRVEITPLKLVHRRAVPWVKELHATKRYRALVEMAEPVGAAELDEALAGMVGEIAQQTPHRVSHRRANLVRRRALHAATGKLLDPTHAEILVHGDGGLYIKELISADRGRTRPSLSERLGIQARVIELDVLEVCSGDVPKSMELSDGLS
jgi:tRNA pseudouridine synthase 10